jgi:dienelactone hydrolase
MCTCLQISLLFAQNFPVGHTTITFNDASRSGGFGSGGGPGRQIQTEIYYPAVSDGNNTALAYGSFPIIVFGHGFAMTWEAYENLWDDFASKGYIMAFPRTEGSLIPAPSHNNFGLDLALVEVKLQDLNANSASLFFQKVANKSAIMGHSMGGGATFIAAANNTSSSLKAVIGLAPAETNPSAIGAAQNVSIAALILSGSSDNVTPAVSNHQPIYDNLASTCKTFISIINGSHCYFANSNFNCDFGELTTGSGSLSRGLQQIITSDYVNLWLDFQLKGSCTSWDTFLDSLSVSTRVVQQQSCNYSYLQPNISMSGNNTFCAGNQLTLSATQNTNYTYSWYLDNLLLANNSNTFLATEPGNYLVSATNSFACIDSSNVFSLISNPSYAIQDTVFACLGSTYIFPDGFITNQNTNHISSLNTISNCDSIINRFVIFGNTVLANESVILCFGSNILINGVSYSTNTTVLDTILNGSLFGCDSITTYDIILQTPDSIILEASICQGDNYQLESGLFVNQAGLYPSTYTNQFGCDSVYLIGLTVGTPIPNFITQFYNFTGNNIGDTIIMALQGNLSYDSIVWITDTLSSLLFQTGDSAYFVLDSAAEVYRISLTVYKDNCSRTYFNNLALVGIKELGLNGRITIYPNPVENIIHIKNDELIQFVKIYNVLGALIFESKDLNYNIQIDCKNFENGVYLIQTDQGTARFSKK